MIPASWRSVFRRHAGKVAEIIGWQGATKIVSLFAFAHAARTLGAERIGIAGSMLAMGLQFAALSSILSDAFLARRYRRARTRAARNLIVSLATTGRLALAVLLLGPLTALAVLWLGVQNAGWALGATILIVVTNLLQPGWLLAAQDRTNVVWRTLGVGSLISSALLFSIRGPLAFTGADLWALALGGLAAAGLGWWAGLTRDGLHVRLVWRRWPLVLAVIRRGGWLFLSYLFANISLNADVLLLARLGSVEDAGAYRPATMLSQAFFQAASFVPLLLFPRLIDWARQGGGALWRKQKVLGGGLLAGTVLLAAVAAVVAPTIFALLYGSAFAAAGGPFVLLLTARALGIVASPFTWGLIALHRDRWMGTINGLGAGVMVAGSVALIPAYGLWGPAIAAVAAETLMLSVAVALSWREGRRGPAGPGGL